MCIHSTCSSCLIKVPPLNTPRTYLSRNQTILAAALSPTRTDGHTSPLQIIMHLLIRLERFENFLRKNDQFLTRIIGYNIFGGIANLLLPSRAAWRGLQN